VMPLPGSRSSRRFRASTSKARSTVVRITGRSGAGIDNGPRKPSKPSAQRNKLSARGRLGRPHHPRRLAGASNVAPDLAAPAAQPSVAQAVRSVEAQGQRQAAQPRAARAAADLVVLSAAVQDQRVPTALPHAGHVRRDPADPLAHQGRAQAGPHAARVDRPIHANSLSRSSYRGGR
jgi:hypothetical protein